MDTAKRFGAFAIYVKNLSVKYPGGIAKPPVHAVRGVDFEVVPGEVVGFVGPNGAGKSTTIKTLMGFLTAESGDLYVMGERAGSAKAKKRIGYLPEVALYYPFLKAGEMLYSFGRMMGVRRRTLKQTVPELLRLVGLDGHAKTYLRTFSKGMLQRIGIAQALLGDPDVLILDEVSSGLDPRGRRDLRDILSSLSDRGKTIFFSSHELSEVELLCSRVLIIHHGSIIQEGSIRDLTRPVRQSRITYRQATGEFWGNERPVKETLTTAKTLNSTLHELTKNGAEIIDVAPERIGLEDYFVGLLAEGGEG